jgi:hypothetical protein
MAYSEKAEKRRRCNHVYRPDHKRAGEQCRAYAMWDSEDGLCAAHGGHTRGRGRRGAPYRCRTTPKCDCEAYAWPHRPGGGRCNWPDPPDKGNAEAGRTSFFNPADRERTAMEWPTTYRRFDADSPDKRLKPDSDPERE